MDANNDVTLLAAARHGAAGSSRLGRRSGGGQAAQWRDGVAGSRAQWRDGGAGSRGPERERWSLPEGPADPTALARAWGGEDGLETGRPDGVHS